MQIYELQLHTLKESQLNEVDLVGPGSIFNVGREVLRNPKALISSQALGAAQQAAAQRYAAKLAPGVTKAAAAAAPQIARQLAAGWAQIAKTLPPPVQTPGGTAPGAQQPAAGQTARPTRAGAKVAGKSSQTPNAQRKRAARAAKKSSTAAPVQEPYSIGGQTISPSDPLWAKIQQQQAKNPTVKEDAVSDYRDQFIKFAQQRLGEVGLRGANLDAIRKDTVANAALDKILDNIVALHAKPAQQQAAVENYFTTAINAWNRISSNPALYQQLNTQNTAADTGRQTNVQAGDADQELKQTLAQIGISTAQLQKLAQVATNAAQGNNAFRPTGNSIIDAVLQAAGMRPTR